jgi:hypothetical protein
MPISARTTPVQISCNTSSSQDIFGKSRQIVIPSIIAIFQTTRTKIKKIRIEKEI